MSRIKIRTKALKPGLLVRMLIEHPMETGRRVDPVTGLKVAPHFIKEIIVSFRGKVVLEGRFSTGISKNPYLTLKLREASPGEILEVRFKDNQGAEDMASFRIPPNEHD